MSNTPSPSGPFPDPTEAPAPSRTAWSTWPTWTCFGLCLALYAFLTVREMSLVGSTVDEPTYFNSGRIIQLEGWSQSIVRLHGPIPYYMNQLFVGDFPPGGYVPAGEGMADLLFRGRLGTLPFGLLGLAVCFLWSKRLFGPAGGLLSAVLFATSPLLIGYGGLLAVDIIHSATVLFCLFQLWRFVVKPTGFRLIPVGISLGIAFATKYLALLNGPVVVIVAATCAAWHARHRGPRNCAFRWLATAGLLSAMAIATLHATYGFKTGFAPTDVEAYQSDLIASLVDIPVAGRFVTAFPRAYLLGVDYQMTMGEGEHWTPFVDGRFASSHPSYYLRSMLWKTPEWTLLIFAWLLAWRLPLWLAGRGSRAERAAAWVLAPPMLVALVYLSLFTGLQIGVRYVLPLFPMMFVLAGAFCKSTWVRRAPRAWGGIAALALIFHAADLRSNWPGLLSYFNHAAGGQDYSFRRFKDSNTDWGQFDESGFAMLQAVEAEPLQRLTLFDGPRFGRVAIQLRDLVQPDTEDSSRARHWLFAFPVQRRVGGSWWMYNVTPAAFEAAVRDDDRVRADLIAAYLGTSDFAAARKHIEQLPDDRARPLLIAVDALESADSSIFGIRARVDAWRSIGRHDRVEQEMLSATSFPDRGPILADALTKQRRTDEAIEVLLQLGNTRTPQATAYLSTLYVYNRRFEEAIEMLESFAAEADPATAKFARERAEEIRATEAPHLRFAESLR